MKTNKHAIRTRVINRYCTARYVRRKKGIKKRNQSLPLQNQSVFLTETRAIVGFH